MTTPDRVAAIATELQFHHTRPGGACTCGYEFRPGEWISLHRAKAADAAILLNEAGVDLGNLHAAVLGAEKLANAAAMTLADAAGTVATTVIQFGTQTKGADA
jgi:hypothetical protein